MGEGNIFSLFTLEGGYPISGLKWRGVPHPRSGGYPISGLGRVCTPSQVWVPHLRLGGTPSQVGGTPSQGGTPCLGGTPCQGWVPHVLGGTPCPGGYPMSRGGTPISGRPPPHCTEQHSEHLLRGGWCASCVHRGGLSCINLILTKPSL